MEDRIDSLVSDLGKDAKVALVQLLLRDPEVRDAPELHDTFARTYSSSLNPPHLLQLTKDKSELFSCLLAEPSVVRSTSSKDVAAFVKATGENAMIDAFETIPEHFSKFLETAAKADVAKYASALALRLRNPGGDTAAAASELSRTDSLIISEALFSARRDARRSCLSNASMSDVVESTSVVEKLPEFTQLLKTKIGVASWQELRKKMEGRSSSRDFKTQTDDIKPGVAELTAALNTVVKKRGMDNESVKDLGAQVAASVGDNAKNVKKFLASVQEILTYREDD